MCSIVKRLQSERHAENDRLSNRREEPVKNFQPNDLSTVLSTPIMKPAVSSEKMKDHIVASAKKGRLLDNSSKKEKRQSQTLQSTTQNQMAQNFSTLSLPNADDLLLSVSESPFHAIRDKSINRGRTVVKKKKLSRARRTSTRKTDSTNSWKRYRREDSVPITLIKGKVLVKCFPNTMANKTRLCLSSGLIRDTNAGSKREEYQSFRTKQTKNETRISNQKCSNNSVGKVVAASKKDLSRESAKELAQCHCDIKSTSLDDPSKAPDSTTCNGSDIIAWNSSAREDSAKTCLRCQTTGCWKMIELERQRLVETRRQHRVKENASRKIQRNK